MPGPRYPCPKLRTASDAKAKGRRLSGKAATAVFGTGLSGGDAPVSGESVTPRATAPGDAVLPHLHTLVSCEQGSYSIEAGVKLPHRVGAPFLSVAR
jgi:hypothetical protein